MSFMEMAVYTKETYNLKETAEEIAAMWLEWSKEAYLYEIKAKEGVYDFLSYLKGQHIPLALATTNKRDLYEPCLIRTKLDKYFDYIANTNDLNTTKSEPTIYLNLASKLNSNPKETIVFEDILIAIKTAKTASFKTVALYDKKNEHDWQKITKEADFYLFSFKDLEK